MADYINRDDLRNALYESDTLTIEGLGILNRFPAADVVEVVRCKDCIHFDSYEGEEHKGDCLELVGLESCVYEDDFCSYGKRKEVEKK